MAAGRQWLVRMNTDTMVLRPLLLSVPFVSQLDSGANLPEDAVYPPLNPATNPEAAVWANNTPSPSEWRLPPAHRRQAFWSITLYDPKDSRSATC